LSDYLPSFYWIFFLKASIYSSS